MVDPLQRSGLVLSGANSWDRDKRNEGILSATEVSFLDLSGAEVVTLGACQSGGGVTVGGEGVLGLVRGFRLAGAGAVTEAGADRVAPDDIEAIEAVLERHFDQRRAGERATPVAADPRFSRRVQAERLFDAIGAISPRRTRG